MPNVECHKWPLFKGVMGNRMHLMSDNKAKDFLTNYKRNQYLKKLTWPVTFCNMPVLHRHLLVHPTICFSSEIPGVEKQIRLHLPSMGQIRRDLSQKHGRLEQHHTFFIWTVHWYISMFHTNRKTTKTQMYKTDPVYTCHSDLISVNSAPFPSQECPTVDNLSYVYSTYWYSSCCALVLKPDTLTTSHSTD